MDTHLAALPDLPVRAVVPEVLCALRDIGSAVLVAPPGTGKTTVVPLALTGDYDGRIVVAEPRRVAARAAARRMASLLGERVGQTVGYSVRGDRKVSDATRIEVVTSGLLVRRLQADTDLPGVAAVVLDECHERHLDADLLLALLLDVRGGLRDDLRLLATSATVAADRLASLLGDGSSAPIVTARTPLFDVTTRHIPPARSERVAACVARAVRTALSEADGDVLAFLPGVGEISAVSGALDDLPDSGVDVQVLHGGLTGSGQDAVLRESERRRVVLATAIAESSVTVPGVRSVVDSGLARVPRVDHRRGLSGLTTVRVSAAVAEQRAGRAARQGPGLVLRCWPEHEHSTLPAYPEPEIAIADLTPLALELACWGTPDGGGLSWWDPPTRGPLDAGVRVLATLGAVDDDGAVTGRGRAMARAGLHPRLARALLDGAQDAGRRCAAEVVALLDAAGASTATDVDAALSGLRRGTAPGARRWRDDVARLERIATDTTGADRRTDDAEAGTRTDDARAAMRADTTPDPAYVIALAHPERIARRRAPGTRVYLMANGTAAELPRDGALADAEWLAVAEATREPGRKHAVIRLAAPADIDLATAAAATLRRTEDEITWDDGDVRARSRDWLGAIELSQRPLADPDPTAIRSALLDGLRTEGTGLLRWSREATALRDRLAFLHRTLGEPWPAMGDAYLLARADEWLEPELSTSRSRADLAALDAGDLLRRLIPWQHVARLDDLAPERIEVPTGSRIRVDYSEGDPVLAVRLQETFGWLRTPVVADGAAPVVLHLLSPAGRPCAVTTDLASFWRNGYPQVRAELRGRYPKHAWPEDPLTAEPTTGTNRRR
ncbi:ATP-dependent helicase HrpB [Haloechinothrix halophila]|uniref:ATP-dependent helicase HrpB n=1 Tax=Haloechinothrix halophila TaxID=1069073 RepID=UPI0003F8F5E3|nr:ATP-dependent helicase HrpB [Haloechinothrix halophila]